MLEERRVLGSSRERERTDHASPARSAPRNSHEFRDVVKDAAPEVAVSVSEWTAPVLTEAPARNSHEFRYVVKDAAPEVAVSVSERTASFLREAPARNSHEFRDVFLVLSL